MNEIDAAIGRINPDREPLQLEGGVVSYEGHLLVGGARLPCSYLVWPKSAGPDSRDRELRVKFSGRTGCLSVHREGSFADGRVWLACEQILDPLLVETRAATTRSKKSTRRSAAQVIRLALDLLEGLAALHRDRICHRRVIPASVVLTARGYVLWTYGSAASTDVDDPSEMAPTSLPAKYRPPEQHRGEAADERSDLYQLNMLVLEQVDGADLWKALSALVSDTDAEWAAFHADSSRPLPSLRSRDHEFGEPRFAGVVEVLDAVGAKQADDRPSSAEECLSLLGMQHVVARRAEASPRARRRVALLGALIALLSCLAGTFLAPTKVRTARPAYVVISSAEPSLTGFVSGLESKDTLQVVGDAETMAVEVDAAGRFELPRGPNLSGPLALFIVRDREGLLRVPVPGLAQTVGPSMLVIRTRPPLAHALATVERAGMEDVTIELDSDGVAILDAVSGTVKVTVSHERVLPQTVSYFVETSARPEPLVITCDTRDTAYLARRERELVEQINTALDLARVSPLSSSGWNQELGAHLESLTQIVEVNGPAYAGLRLAAVDLRESGDRAGSLKELDAELGRLGLRTKARTERESMADEFQKALHARPLMADSVVSLARRIVDYDNEHATEGNLPRGLLPKIRRGMLRSFEDQVGRTMGGQDRTEFERLQELAFSILSDRSLTLEEMSATVLQHMNSSALAELMLSSVPTGSISLRLDPGGQRVLVEGVLATPTEEQALARNLSSLIQKIPERLTIDVKVDPDVFIARIQAAIRTEVPSSTQVLARQTGGTISVNWVGPKEDEPKVLDELARHFVSRNAFEARRVDPRAFEVAK